MPWKGYEKAVEFFKEFRAELEGLSEAPVHLTWCYRMDPQVKEIHGDAGWAIVNYPEQLNSLVNAGDELGLHTHPFRWDEKTGRWLQDYGNQPWVEHCVRMAFETFRSQLGRPCVSFRFGDRWMNNPTFALLEQLGVKYDLTLEPGSKKLPSYHPKMPFTGAIPDQRRVPRRMYRPAKSNYKKSDVTRLDGTVIIPTSTAPIQLNTGELYRPPSWYQRLLFRIINPARLKNWSHSLNIALGPKVFQNILRYNLEVIGTPYVAMVARAHIFTEAEFTDNVRANLSELFNYNDSRGSRRFFFTTPEVAVTKIIAV
jgi:hypothetical protein